MSVTERAGVDWSAYAEVYDLMARVNPAYRILLAEFEREVAGWRLPPGSTVIDVGGGTGNFSCPLARRFRESRVLLVDPSGAMTERARLRAAAEGLDNLEVIDRPLDEADLQEESVDAVVSVHALYTLPRPGRALERMRRWLRADGRLFVCDIGRVIDTGDWARYLFDELRRRHGLAATLALFWRGRAVAGENRRIAAEQRRGGYWTHSSEEFARALRAAGFEILRQRSAYRGYSDLAVCAKA